MQLFNRTNTHCTSVNCRDHSIDTQCTPHRTAVLFSRCNRPYIGQLDDCDLLSVTFLLFLPVLNLPLPLELFVYLHLITGILSLCISTHLTVLLLLNPVLNLTFSLVPNHSYASTSDSTSDYSNPI